MHEFDSELVFPYIMIPPNLIVFIDRHCWSLIDDIPYCMEGEDSLLDMAIYHKHVVAVGLSQLLLLGW